MVKPFEAYTYICLASKIPPTDSDSAVSVKKSKRHAGGGKEWYLIKKEKHAWLVGVATMLLP